MRALVLLLALAGAAHAADTIVWRAHCRFKGNADVSHTAYVVDTSDECLTGLGGLVLEDRIRCANKQAGGCTDLAFRKTCQCVPEVVR